MIETQSANRSLAGRHILLVDDEPSNIFAMKRVLKRWEVITTTASSGDEAIAHLRAQPDHFDLVLMDIMMPGKDGYVTMREIRGEQGFANLPIIALTAKAMLGDRELCLEAGATDYLSKPVDMDVLKKIMERMLLG